MVRVKILGGTIAAGIGHVGAGEVHDVDPSVATNLFVAGKAVPYAEKPAETSTRKSAKQKVAKK